MKIGTIRNDGFTIFLAKMIVTESTKRANRICGFAVRVIKIKILRDCKEPKGLSFSKKFVKITKIGIKVQYERLCKSNKSKEGYVAITAATKILDLFDIILENAKLAIEVEIKSKTRICQTKKFSVTRVLNKYDKPLSSGVG